MNFDMERFIIEVQGKPSIWNTKSAEYSDKNVRRRAWEELVDIYGADLSQDEKKKLGLDLQKKCRNIRDNLVKAHKAKESKSGSAAKKKVPYVFYDILLFLKDTVSVNDTKGNTDDIINESSQNADAISLNSPSPITPAPKSKKKKQNDDPVGAQLVGVLTKNLERKNLEEDDDRLYFLSLVKEFKKIPEYLQMQAKLDILKLINDAQQTHLNEPTSWSGGRNNTHRGYQTAQYSRYSPYSIYSPAVRPPSHGTASVASPFSTMEEQSSMSAHSQESQDSDNSSRYIELFNSVQFENTE